MTRHAPLLAVSILFAACAGEADAPASGPGTAPVEVSANAAVVGAAPEAGAVLAASEAIARADDLDGQTIRVEGEVAEVCQMAGCWLTFHNEAGVPFRVSVPRDESGAYEFTFPTDVAGSSVVVQGTLDVTVTDVTTRRHLAEDGGASAEEVAAITEPERTVVLNATGARIERPAEA